MTQCEIGMLGRDNEGNAILDSDPCPNEAKPNNLLWQNPYRIKIVCDYHYRLNTRQ